MNKLGLSSKKTSNKDVRNIHAALRALNLKVDKKEVVSSNLGVSSIDAIKSFQKEHKLNVTGTLTDQTLVVLNEALADAYYSNNKGRTTKIHNLLERLDIPIPIVEKRNRVFGPNSRKAIKQFQREAGISEDGKINEAVIEKLHERVIAKKFTTKTQVGKLQFTLQKALEIAKLPVKIAETELKAKEIGPSTAKGIKEFQTKYNLSATGELDKPTLDKIQSVASSKGTFVRKLSKPPVSKLNVVTKPLRLNMVSPTVAEMQKNLAFLGYKIAEKEFNTQTFGKTTIKAVKQLQEVNGIAITGHYDKATSEIVNKKIVTVNPKAQPTHRYRIRGSVRNLLWERKNDMLIKIYELFLDNVSDELAVQYNFSNGFFDIAYDAPINPINGKVKDEFHLVVKLYNASNQNNPVAIQKHYNVNQTQWVNFTECKNDDGTTSYNGKYLGASEYEVTKAILGKAIGEKQISELKETADDKQITLLNIQTGLNTDGIMQHVLSQLVSQSINNPLLGSDVFYAFIAQNLPPDLPSDLLRGTSEWETIAQMTEIASSGIIFLEDSIQLQVIDNAVAQNLVSQKIKLDRDAILAALKNQRIDFTLSKPILVGNGNLKSLLDSASVEKSKHAVIADAFIKSKGINTDFWNAIKAEKAEIGADAIAAFTTTVEVAYLAKNHMATVDFLKKNIGDRKKFKRVGDVAKLDHDGIVSLINENGKKVPNNMPGDTLDEKVANYAAAIKNRSNFLYPAVSLVATTKRTKQNALENIDEVEKFIDEQKELNFREQNLDKYIKDNQISINKNTRSSLKVLQRIHKLTKDPLAGAVLIDHKMHSSMQIYFTGKERITNLLKEKKVEDIHINQLYESSRIQYMKILGRITDFRKEMYRDTPAAIIPHTYSAKEIQDTLKDIPDLETLFGSLDYCDCEHCKSLFGPAAYLMDMLRFLKEHLAIDYRKTVQDVLFDRRPDIGNIKLNCENTNTPLPYIDLVCEILENNLTGNKDFVYQTVLSQKELRAIPQNIQPMAYAELASKDFPMNISFNLWQEEARAYLDYLRVPRYEIMEVFQDKNAKNKYLQNQSPLKVVLKNEESFDFSTNIHGIIDGGDLYYTGGKFWGNNFNQKEVIDLGNIGNVDLATVNIPNTGYTCFGVVAVKDHTYIAKTLEKESAGYIVFRVTAINADKSIVNLEYLNPKNTKKDFDDMAIAAEYFKLSWKERDLILSSRPSAADQKTYWEFDTTKSHVAVTIFLKRSKLNYDELLELLMVNFVNDPAVNKSVIVRNLEVCDTAQQTINNLTPAKFDAMHRFIRLWRKTGWKMWELDLLLRNAKIGASKINEASLVQLKLFNQLQEKLKLPFEILLAFYGDINREVRIKPEKQDVLIQPMYNILFQNIAVTNPIDSKFRAIGNLTNQLQSVDLSLLCNSITLNSSILLVGTNPNGYTPVPTILSALAINQTDFDALVGKTNNHLSIKSLSILFRYVYLARSLKLSISDFVTFLDVTQTSDPFANVQATIDCWEDLTLIKRSGLSMLELDYALNYRPDSPIGLREESLAQFISGLRRILEDSKNQINFLNQLIALDADAIDAITNTDNFMAAFSPFQSSLISTKLYLSGDAVSMQELKFIHEFNKLKLVLADGTPNPDAMANKSDLIANIKKVQLSANTFLVDTVAQKQNQIKSHIASCFSISTEQSSVLLTKLFLVPATTTLIRELENENLIAINAEGEYDKITRENFPNHFNIYNLLHKSVLLAAKLKIKTENLDYFIEHKTVLKTIDWSALPVNAPVVSNQFENLKNLYLFLEFASKFPEPGNVSIRSILDLAQNPGATALQIKTEISLLTKWCEGDAALANLTSVEKGIGIKHNVSRLDYTHAWVYHCLLKCFEQMKLIGVDASIMLGWSTIDNKIDKDRIVAQQIREAVKSKYEQEDWLTKMTPLNDELREMKRNALVAYHIDYSQRTAGNLIFGLTSMNNPKWEDSNSLFKYFLIDVEMSSCQLTSRIKQALSSVQLFVQRCFLNLESKYVIIAQGEKDDSSSPNAWLQWRWMKNYRVWEANRKIFFYPENWLEPELRDDKSPFFKELENELMQNEVTKENVETAFLNYLHKVDEVSHLEVCGLYHQKENLAPDELGFYEINTVHVIGRTKAVPNIYYYRSYDMNYNTWSAWDKIEVDITGDHLVPVVYNRKLHLFWLQFMEKPMKIKKIPAAQPSDKPTDAPEALKVIEIQLAWTVKKTDGWSTKKMSKQKLVHPWERPHFSYHLKPFYLSKFNELYLDIYLSTSKEFNDTKFYDPSKPLFLDRTALLPAFADNPKYHSTNRFNETYRPWHSSAFVFNGEVSDLKLKALRGINSTLRVSGPESNYLYGPEIDNSYRYIYENFGEMGRAIKELQPIEFGPRLRLPNGMHFKNNSLVNNKVHSKNDSSLRVLEDSATTSLINKALSPFEMVITHQDLQLDTMTREHPIFYQDSQRTFFIKPEWEKLLDNYGQLISQNRKYRFLPFYHPYTMLFIREFNRAGIDGLLNRKIQTKPQSFTPKNNFDFKNYSPTNSAIVDVTSKTDTVDFSYSGAYSLYNWELFFHAPLMIATRLTQNQKFEDAMKWYHYIFDPTNIESRLTPQRYWVTKPFYEYNSEDYRMQRIESILTNINQNDEAKIKNMNEWKNNPFKPHLVARNRPVAYQKNVVMKYLDNLIAWGDMLFKQDTIESINEASLLYMLAYEILGDRPQKIPNVKHEELTFNEIEKKLDDMGNARIDAIVEDTLLPVTVVTSAPEGEPIPKLDMFYFCIPNNDFITKYWDTVEDRLFKIRHCMNIAGIVRQLPLFEPPIDPALLVKAAAAGIDLGSVLSDLDAPTPFYRFRIVIQKAMEFCSDVKALGEKLLGVLERKDIEQLSLMRSQHEIQMLEAVKEIRKKQINEAVETIGSLNKSKESAEKKQAYFKEIPRMNEWEISGVVLHGGAIASEVVATVLNAVAGVASALPLTFTYGVSGFGGSPVFTQTYGSKNVAESSINYAALFQGLSSILHSTGNLIDAQGAFTRRDDENKQQASLAAIEIDQIQHQINVAEIRQSIAEKELENQELQIENIKAVDAYMKDKYTNEQLFSWMITQVSTVYFQAYQLAFDMAKKAEKCFMQELGITDSKIVQFGYWDSLKKGLLSGDKLMNDLRRLDAEYLNQNKREFEITKHISLTQIAPLSLITLKETGQCRISLPEWLFDMDYPGQYMRRIKNVSISVPCIVGPYTSVNCTLSLLKNETRMDATLNGGAYAKGDASDTRFKTMFGAISSIATSHAQNDNGMFELNFNDERYLPFEGAGVLSEWQINMPKENNYFDFSSLSDVILHISYTSRNGGGQLVAAANTDLEKKLPNSTARLFNLKDEFSTEWYRFLYPAGDADQEFVIDLNFQHFPFFIRGKLNALKIKKIQLFVESKDEVASNYIANIKITDGAAINNISIKSDLNFNSLPHVSKDLIANTLGSVSLKIKTDSIDNNFKSLTNKQIDNIFLLLHLGK